MALHDQIKMPATPYTQISMPLRQIAMRRMTGRGETGFAFAPKQNYSLTSPGLQK